MFRVVIPARYASVRLPGKPLRAIGGKPMIQHVFERAVASGAQETWVATDDARIAAACRRFGAAVAMTSTDCATGSDRVAEVALQQGWADEDIVVNVQGDEPLLPSALIDRVVGLLVAHPQAGIATLATPIRSLEELLNRDVVKVVANPRGIALYFSRAPIPWHRDGVKNGAQTCFDGALRHLGLYAYRTGALRRLASLPPSPLESIEKLEQLRALENDITMMIAVAADSPPAGVDNEQDLARVEAFFTVKG